MFFHRKCETGTYRTMTSLFFSMKHELTSSVIVSGRVLSLQCAALLRSQNGSWTGQASARRRSTAGAAAIRPPPRAKARDRCVTSAAPCPRRAATAPGRRWQASAALQAAGALVQLLYSAAEAAVQRFGPAQARLSQNRRAARHRQQSKTTAQNNVQQRRRTTFGRLAGGCSCFAAPMAASSSSWSRLSALVRRSCVPLIAALIILLTPAFVRPRRGTLRSPPLSEPMPIVAASPCNSDSLYDARACARGDKR